MTWSRKVIETSTANLSPVQKTILAKILGLTGDTLTAGEAMVFWLADLLSWVRICDSDQQRLIIELFCKDIREHGERVHTAVVTRQPVLPVSFIGFGDRHMVTITGQQVILDLNTGELKDLTLTEQLLETLNYNLTALYTRKYRALTKRQEEKTDESRVSTSPTGYT